MKQVTTQIKKLIAIALLLVSFICLLGGWFSLGGSFVDDLEDELDSMYDGLDYYAKYDDDIEDFVEDLEDFTDKLLDSSISPLDVNRTVNTISDYVDVMEDIGMIRSSESSEMLAILNVVKMVFMVPLVVISLLSLLSLLCYISNRRGLTLLAPIFWVLLFLILQIAVLVLNVQIDMSVFSVTFGMGVGVVAIVASTVVWWIAYGELKAAGTTCNLTVNQVVVSAKEMIPDKTPAMPTMPKMSTDTAVAGWTCGCGTQVAGDGAFCSSCGAKRPESAPSAPAASVFCANCGKPITAQSAFCGECGTPVK